jgi:hypothetical protein
MPILGILASSISGNLSASSFDSIATTTVGAGGASSISFTSIPSTYTHLQIRYIASDTSTAGSTWGFCSIKFNNSTTNYGYRHDFYGTGASVGAGGASATYPMSYTGNNGYFGAGIIDVLDYATTNKNKTVRYLNGNDQNGGGLVSLGSGLWMNTAAINQIDLTAGTLFTQYSKFALYGIKG